MKEEISMLYKGSDYCRDSKCMTQIFLDLPDTSRENRKRLKKLCRECEAFKFHRYLVLNGFEIIKREATVVKCVGCGFCCMQSPCWVGQRLHGVGIKECPSLYWNEDSEMYRCKAAEMSNSVKEELYIGDGCCPGLNSWRLNVRARKDIKDNDPIKYR
jgi:hypothetical protein